MIHRDPIHPKVVREHDVYEAPRTIRVRDSVDVLICGGGPAGVGAALAASREGARTMLVERFGMLGGMWTVGLVNPFFECWNKGYIVQEMIDRLKAAGAWRRWLFAATFDPEVMKLTLESMMAEAGVQLLYYTVVTDAILEEGSLRGVVIESKAGREAIIANVVVDATGDGDVAARAGCSYEIGREPDGVVQPVTLMFEVSGAEWFEQTEARPLFDKMQATIERERLNISMPTERAGYAPWIITLPSNGISAVQTTHVYRINPLDPADLTNATIAARRQASEMETVLRKTPGFEKVRLLRTAPTLGLRESRRVFGRARLAHADLMAGRRFPNAIATCAFGIDVHTPDPDSSRPNRPDGRSRAFEIPYGCLVAADVEGLLLAGRCISGDHHAHAAYRVTGTAMATGQAAGMAAAWSVRDREPPSRVDGVKLKAALAARGTRFFTELPPFHDGE